MEPRSRSIYSRSSAGSRAFCLILWSVLTQFALAQPSLTLRVEEEYVTPGGWAQIKVFADKPTLIARGTLAIDLDPQVFGSIASIASFSAAGDAIGLAYVNGTHAEVSLNAPAGGIGQLPDAPVFLVRAAVLPNAAASGYVSLSLPSSPPEYGASNLNYPEDAWADPSGQPYRLTLLSGRTGRRGGFSIENIDPGAGFRPVGTVVVISGSGFSPAARVHADRVTFSSVQVVSPTRIEATLANAAELAGTRFELSDSQATAVFYASPESAVPSGSPAPPEGSPALHMILPFSEFRYGSLNVSSGSASHILQNPNASPAQVIVRSIGALGGAYASERREIAPGALLRVGAERFGTGYIESDVPLRQVHLFANNAGRYVRTAGLASPPAVPPLQMRVSPTAIAIDYQTGSPEPQPQTVRLSGQRGQLEAANLQIDAGPWLEVSSADTGSLTLRFHTTGLAPGTYTGSIAALPIRTATQQDYPIEAVTLPVTLNVSEAPTISVTHLEEPMPPSGRLSVPAFLVRSNGTPASFTIRTQTQDGGNWLAVDTPTGSTNTTVSVLVNPAGLTAASYAGTIFVEGPRNTVEVGIAYYPVYPPPRPPLQTRSRIAFTFEEGSVMTPSEILSYTGVSGRISATAQTADGGDWLIVETSNAGTGTSATVRINLANLPPGAYHGVVTGSAGGESVQTQVTLTVVAKAQSLLTASPSSLTFRTPAGVQSAPQLLRVLAPDPPGLFRVTSASAPLHFDVEYNPETNGALVPGEYPFYALGNTPGTYRTSIQLQNAVGVTTIPVTIYITASPQQPPVLTSVVNAASHRAGPVAPGEMITLHGLGIGPFPTGVQLDSGGGIAASTDPSARVTINGTPAPILYGAPEQWNVIVPYEVEGAPTATIQVSVNGVDSKPWTLPVAAAAPGIFTTSSSGAGQGAVLNQDNTVNSAANPAPAGTIVQIYATGGGQTNPAGITGSVNSSTGATRLPVKALFSENEAPVVYAGPAPGFASGALQVNAIVPSVGIPGTTKTVRLQLEIDGLRSAPVDVAVR